MRYAFTNFINDTFKGRYGGVDYIFASGEVREFDSDKHQMLIIMAKQLADQELLKNIKSVGKNPNDQERYGKSLDANGEIYTMTVEDRKSLMRRAIGELVDVAVPVPADLLDESEVGATVNDTEVKEKLDKQDTQIAEMKEMIANLTSIIAKNNDVPAVVKPVELPVASVPAPEVLEVVVEPAVVSDPISAEAAKPAPDMSFTREVLFTMAKESGLNPTDEMTKEQVLELLNSTEKMPT